MLGPNGSGKTSLHPGAARPAAAVRAAARSRASPGGQPAHRLHPAAAGDRRQPDAARPRPGRPRPGRAPLGRRLAQPPRTPGRAWTRRWSPSARRGTPTRRSACSPAASSSGCGWRRRWSATPSVLLCDEPLLSLDLAHQRVVSDLIDARRRAADTAVLFVTHEINPILPLVDRVLYLVDGRFRIGTPDEVMTSRTLSELYRTERRGGPRARPDPRGRRAARCARTSRTTWRMRADGELLRLRADRWSCWATSSRCSSRAPCSGWWPGCSARSW